MKEMQIEDNEDVLAKKKNYKDNCDKGTKREDVEIFDNEENFDIVTQDLNLCRINSVN